MEIPIKIKWRADISCITGSCQCIERFVLKEMDGYYLLEIVTFSFRESEDCGIHDLDGLKAFSDVESAKGYLESIGVEMHDPESSKPDFLIPDDFD